MLSRDCWASVLKRKLHDSHEIFFSGPGIPNHSSGIMFPQAGIMSFRIVRITKTLPSLVHPDGLL